MNESEKKRFESALFSIPSDDRETWFSVGAAIKTTMGDAGFDLFDRWSRTSKRYIEKNQHAQWISFKPGLYKPGTIFHAAKQNGWSGQSVPDYKLYNPISRHEEEKRRTSSRKRGLVASSDAQRMVDNSEESTHPYLFSKGFPEVEVLTYTGRVRKRDPKPTEPEFFEVKNVILIPVRNKNNEVVSAQLIDTTGKKLFLPGGVMHGGRYVLGRGRETWVCEGFATALTLKLALNTMYRDFRIVIAFSSSNIPNVVSKDDYVVVDHDIPAKKEKYGSGEKFARKSGCAWYQPTKIGDINDMQLETGIMSVASDLRRFILTTSKNNRKTKHV